MGSRRDNARMARERTIYSCIECGGTSPKWLGRCPGCGAWNTLEETIPEPVPAGRNRIQHNISAQLQKKFNEVINKWCIR